MKRFVKVVYRYFSGKKYKRWFSRFYPENEQWYKEYVFGKERKKETDRERFIRTLSKYDNIDSAFWRWTK